MTKTHGSNFERRGKRLAIGMALVSVAIIGFFLLRSLGSSGQGGGQAAPPPPPPPGPGQMAGGVDGQMSGEGMHIQFTAPEDPSKVTGELRSKSVEPQEARRYLVVEPEMWLYQDDGSTIMVRAANGRLFMPSQSQEPESGRLEGGVLVHMYEPRADGSRVVTMGDDEPAVIAETEWLDFDMALGEASTDAPLTIDTEQIDFAGVRMRARFDELRERLVMLEVLEGGSITYDPGADPLAELAGEDPADDAVDASRAAAPGKTNANAPKRADRPAPRRNARAEETPQEVLYFATFEQDVIVHQAGKSITADLLEVWARTFDNTLRDGAIRRVKFADVGPQAVSAAPVMAPRSAPVIVSSLATAVQPEADDAANDLVTLEWTGPLRVRPVEDAAELARDDLALRFSSETANGVKLVDADAGGEGAMTSLAYAATTARVDASGDAASPAWFDAPGQGHVEFERAQADLVNGLIHMSGALLARAVDEQSEVRCSDGADLALHFLNGELTGLLREAIFNGDVRALSGDSVATGEIARASFALDQNEDGAASRIEHFHLEGDDAAPARLAQGDDESLQGRVIDVTLAPGPDTNPDPTHVVATGDVSGRQGEAELTAGALDARLSRNDEGELVVDTADASGGVHFVRASDDIEVRADALQAWPEQERAVFMGDDSMVRRRTASVHGGQIELDGLARKINVFGPGRFDDALGTGATASWSREMLFNDADGVLECHGDVVAVIQRDALTRDTIRAMRVLAQLEPPDEIAQPSGLDALDGSMEDLMGERRLVSAVAIGESEEVEGGLPAIVQSVQHEIVVDDEGVESTRPAQALLLEGPRIQLEDAGDRLLVPHAGRLVVADQREPAPTANEDEFEDVRGQAMFTWTGQFDFNRTAGEATMFRGVRATMIEPAVSRVTLLDAERMVALLGDVEETQASLLGARADGAVYLAQKSEGLTAFEVIADGLQLDNVAKTAQATSSPGNVVTVFEGGRPTPATAERFFFDLATGRWEVRGPGLITTPR